MAPKRLSTKDMTSLAEYKKEREKYTDQDAQSLGYPNAQVLRLADLLSDIAGKWRKTKESRYVDEYQTILSMMRRKGYDVETLPIEDQLPKPIMAKLLSSIVKPIGALRWKKKRESKVRHSSKMKSLRIAKTRGRRQTSKQMSKAKFSHHSQDSE